MMSSSLTLLLHFDFIIWDTYGKKRRLIGILFR